MVNEDKNCQFIINRVQWERNEPTTGNFKVHFRLSRTLTIHSKILFPNFWLCLLMQQNYLLASLSFSKKERNTFKEMYLKKKIHLKLSCYNSIVVNWTYLRSLLMFKCILPFCGESSKWLKPTELLSERKECFQERSKKMSRQSYVFNHSL